MGSNPFEGTKLGGLENNPYIWIMKTHLKYLPYKIAAAACVSVVPLLISLTGTSAVISYIMSGLIFLVFCVQYNNRNRSTEKVWWNCLLKHTQTLRQKIWGFFIFKN